jgi:hypothetical protein
MRERVNECERTKKALFTLITHKGYLCERVNEKIALKPLCARAHTHIHNTFIHSFTRGYSVRKRLSNLSVNERKSFIHRILPSRSLVT